MYHRVAALDPDVYRLCVAPETFRDHMSEVKDHYHPMALTALADALASGEVPSRSVVITLDDGCIDNFTSASAILQEFDIPATFFIPTERLDEKREFWWDRLERIFISPQKLPSRLDLGGDGAEIYTTRNQDEKRAAHQALAEKIRGLGPDARDTIMNRISAWAGVDMSPRETHRPMITDELRELSKRDGHTIGAHGVHHVGLPTLSTDQQRREMLESKDTLERLLGTKVTAFAYPYGHCGEATVQLARSAFRIAVTATRGAVATGANAAALPRVDASQMTRRELTSALDSMFRA